MCGVGEHYARHTQKFYTLNTLTRVLERNWFRDAATAAQVLRARCCAPLDCIGWQCCCLFAMLCFIRGLLPCPAAMHGCR